MSTETQRVELSLDRCANCRHPRFRHQAKDGHCSYDYLEDPEHPSMSKAICGCRSFVLESKHEEKRETET